MYLHDKKMSAGQLYKGRKQEARSQVSDQWPVVRCSLSVFYSIFPRNRWPLATGHWSLLQATGHWSLTISGFWLLTSVLF